eukprot:jgi/Pico_ML_1/52484/g3183.t1
MSKESTRPPSSSVFVGNIAYDQTEESMKKLFEQVGPVESFRECSHQDVSTYNKPSLHPNVFSPV